MWLRRFLFAILLLHLGAFESVADTVVLVNGDRLTGQVKKVEEGKLVLQTRILGTLRIDWTKIRSVESESDFSVLTTDGERHDGRLSRDGSTTRVSAGGSGESEVASDSVARVVRGRRPTGPISMLSALSGDADVGYSLARGNQNGTQSSLGARASYSSAHYSFVSRLDSLFARQDGARAQSRHALSARMEHFLSGRLFAYGLSGFERNERRRLDLRTRLGGGAGWLFRDRGRTRFSALGGVAYNHERFREQANRVSGEAFAGFEWRTRLFKALVYDMALTVHSYPTERNRTRVEFDATLGVPIAGPFKYSLRLFDRYDTLPAQSVSRNDYGVVSGLGIKF